MLNAGCSLIGLNILADAAGGLVLKTTLIAEIYVLLMVVWVCLAGQVILRVRSSDRNIFRAFIVFTIAFVGTFVALGFTELKVLCLICSEDHLVEWATAVMLFVAFVVALAAMVRLISRGRHLPVVACLTAGSLVACVREMEWGEPFFGRPIWLSRAIFRGKAYVDPDYFQRFQRQMELQGTSRSPYLAHLIFSGVLILLVVVLVAYLVRYRKELVSELRRFPRAAYCWFFALSIGGFALSQALGALSKRLFKTGFFQRLPTVHLFVHCIVEEPIELWAAACALMSALMLWRAHFRKSAERDVEPLDEERATR